MRLLYFFYFSTFHFLIQASELARKKGASSLCLLLNIYSLAFDPALSPRNDESTFSLCAHNLVLLHSTFKRLIPSVRFELLKLKFWMIRIRICPQSVFSEFDVGAFVTQLRRAVTTQKARTFLACQKMCNTWKRNEQHMLQIFLCHKHTVTSKLDIDK